VKILLDSNVWVAGFATRGLCADLLQCLLRLHEEDECSVLVCPAVQSEVIRILRDKIGLDPLDLHRVEIIMGRMEAVADGRWSPPPGFPDPGDVPIVGAALHAAAAWLVTGDAALQALETVESVQILSPRAAFLHLRGLA